MASIFDIDNFKWSDRRVQELYRSVIEQYPDVEEIKTASDFVGINGSKINWRKASAYVWKDVLDAAVRAALLRDLVQHLVDEGSPRNPRILFLKSLLDDVDTPLSAEPRGKNAAPLFLSGSDEITKQEALLFYDDLSVSIGLIPQLRTVLGTLLTLAPSVCKVISTIPEGTQYGTAFRIGAACLLTNHHVVHDKNDARATRICAEFGYEEDAKGNGLATKTILCDPQSIVADKTNDWAIVTPLEPLDPAWPIIPLQSDILPQVNQKTYIIQHPAGGRKRVAFIRNLITKVDENVVQYLTDTQGGSSGSPVFDEQGRVIALHHAGGLPQTSPGKSPVAKNEGIRISRVVEGLRKAGIAIP